MRPLFRACLISLTMSDIITAVFMYTNYMSQMTNALSGVWVISRAYEKKTCFVHLIYFFKIEFG